MKKIYYCCFGILLFGLNACNVIYVPNTIHEPMVNTKGDLNLNITAQDFQTAYAFTDNFSVMGNGFYSTYKSIPESASELDTTNNNGYLVEFGLGYTNKISNLFSATLYGGMGFGSVDFSNNNPNAAKNKKFSSQVSKIFFQPGLFYKSDYFDASGNVRLSIINFKNPIYTNYTNDDIIANKIDNIDKDGFLFIEPAITVRAGYKFIKGFLQFGKSFNTNTKQINYEDNILKIGLNFNYNL